MFAGVDVCRMLDGVSRPDLRLRAAVVLLGLLGLALVVGRASPGFAARAVGVKTARPAWRAARPPRGSAARAQGLKAAQPPRAAPVVRRERARGDPTASGPAAA